MGRTTKVWTLLLPILLWHSPTFAETRNFNDLFKLENEFELQQTKKDPIKDVFRLKVGRDGRIWIPLESSGESEVRVYTPEGEMTNVIRRQDISPLVHSPYFSNLAFSQNYQAYILEFVSGNVVVTDSAGRFVTYFASEHDADCRAGAVSIRIDKVGNVYIGGPCYQETDICPKARDFCIHRYDAEGEYVLSFFPFEKGLFELTSVPGGGVYFDFDSDGNIWCVHAMIYQIYKYSPAGELIESFPGKCTLYKAPIKFKGKSSVFLTGKSQKARRAWWKTWTQISGLLVVEPGLILLTLQTHTPSRYVMEIYDQEGNVLATGIQTDHRLLGEDDQGFLYFLLDAEENQENLKYRIGKFSLNLSAQSTLGPNPLVPEER
jgi:hypothetical protein